jgi:hypothetical protein
MKQDQILKTAGTNNLSYLRFKGYNFSFIGSFRFTLIPFSRGEQVIHFFKFVPKSPDLLHAKHFNSLSAQVQSRENRLELPNTMPHFGHSTPRSATSHYQRTNS